ncbi:MAG: sulfatase-like hydrolase/transferase, partial [Planctomycetia bacterium]|nr:sulfatase-like hydrolase/transferase [Planctomycetia bacterium]
RNAGYRTIHVGKAHFGAIGTACADPRAMGFDVNIAGHAAGGPGSYLGTKNFGGLPDPQSVWAVPGLEKYHGKDIFLSEALTIEALHQIDEAVKGDQPFFLYMSHYAVHVPFAKDERFFQKYVDAGLDPMEAMYAALIEGMDDSLGKILDKLDATGVRDRTIVLFMSDNGGLSAHARGGTPHTHNRPLASGKGSAYEGGIREPMIVSWPGVTSPGSRCDDPLIIEDFYPTILGMAGIGCDAGELGYPVDGISFEPMLRGVRMNQERPMYWHYPNEWGASGPGIGASSTIRRGDWKLIYFHADQRYELYHIAEDIGEHRNLASQRPELCAELAAQLGAYLRSVDAQMPTIRATGQLVPLPGETVDGDEDG